MSFIAQLFVIDPFFLKGLNPDDPPEIAILIFHAAASTGCKIQRILVFRVVSSVLFLCV
jgi:hypothetical protein